MIMINMIWWCYWFYSSDKPTNIYHDYDNYDYICYNDNGNDDDSVFDNYENDTDIDKDYDNYDFNNDWYPLISSSKKWICLKCIY